MTTETKRTLTQIEDDAAHAVMAERDVDGRVIALIREADANAYARGLAAGRAAPDCQGDCEDCESLDRIGRERDQHWATVLRLRETIKELRAAPEEGARAALRGLLDALDDPDTDTLHATPEAYRRTTDAINNARAALRSPPPSPATEPREEAPDVVCAEHWHGLNGSAVDGSIGCPWCHVRELQTRIAYTEDAGRATNNHITNRVEELERHWGIHGIPGVRLAMVAAYCAGSSDAGSDARCPVCGVAFHGKRWRWTQAEVESHLRACAPSPSEGERP